MRRAALACLCACPYLAAANPAPADEAGELKAAIAWARPALASSCDFTAIDNADDFGGSRVYHIHYRVGGQDQDSPDEIFTLVQLFCQSGAYNVSFVFLAAGAAAGEYKLLSFAEPKVDFDYTDESFRQLVAPPRVTGYVSRSELMNPSFDVSKGILSSDAKWRGLGDAWSHGQWRFIGGEFVLSRYVIDPIYDLNRHGAASEAAPPAESYVVYPPTRE